MMIIQPIYSSKPAQNDQIFIPRVISAPTHAKQTLNHKGKIYLFILTYWLQVSLMLSNYSAKFNLDYLLLRCC